MNCFNLGAIVSAGPGASAPSQPERLDHTPTLRSTMQFTHQASAAQSTLEPHGAGVSKPRQTHSHHPLSSTPRSAQGAMGLTREFAPCRVSRRTALGSLLVVAASTSGMVSNAQETTQQAPPITKVFVAGATGNTGQRVVRELRARGIDVVAGVRSPEKAAALGFDQDPGITIVRADVTEGVEPLKAALGDAQAVISALGYNGGSDPAGFIEVDSKGTINLIEAAKASGVRWFVLESSVLTGADKGGLLAKLGYAALNFGTNALDRKKEAEAALKAAAASGSFSYTIVRPAALTNDPEDAVGVPYFEKEDAILGAQKVSRDSVAKLMVEAVVQQGPATNKTVEIASKKGGTAVPASQWFP